MFKQLRRKKYGAILAHPVLSRSLSFGLSLDQNATGPCRLQVAR